ncbi:Retrovirus-related Pol polyprotein from transposon 297 [Labeo rohita]|uniref:ribonuclease H n=1 Tax=Labeo rohita TaxID=84645 RepID=A0A498NY67_LABRO|nr:Retrovirus-related Pol polyprotein from transposon 297 [Labeo rohita]
MEQIIKGALTTDMVAMRLRVTHSLRDPPNFSDLLREVREEENWIKARDGAKAGVATTTAVPRVTAPEKEVDSLKHDVKELSAQPVENLEIWGLSSHKYPYDGYLPIRLEFTEAVAGVPQTVDTLALVCPDPKPEQPIAILVGTNTSLVRQLFDACKEKEGENFLNVLTVHPVVKAAYETIQNSIRDTSDPDKPGVVWFIQHKPITLKAGEVRQIYGKPKFSSELLEKYVLIDQATDTIALEELLVRPELQPASVVSNRMITVTVKNMSSKEVLLKRGTPIAHIFPVDVVPQLTPKSNVSAPNTSLSPESFDFGNSPLPEEAKQRLIEKLLGRQDVFSAHEWDVGCSKSTVHEIRLSDATPFRERSRRLAPKDLEDVRKHLLELQKCGIITESKSPYASPIVVVRKKSGSVRMCVDYRTLNRRTIPDQYTVPRIEDALHCLSGSKWFSVLDLRSGYYQIPMNKDDQEKTAFICPLGFFEFERMPQGISGAPATFQRVMERTVGDMNFLEVLVYLDDLIIFGRTIEEHEERLLKVLDRLREEGLKLSLDKCQFCRTSVTYVGHIVSQEGIATDPSKVEAVISWPRPRTNEPRNADSNELREAQELDSCLGKVRLAISQKQPPSSVKCDHPDLKLWKKKWGNLVVEKGVLYRVIPLSDNRTPQV